MITLLRIRLWYVMKLNDLMVRMEREKALHQVRMIAASMIHCDINR